MGPVEAAELTGELERARRAEPGEEA